MVSKGVPVTSTNHILYIKGDTFHRSHLRPGSPGLIVNKCSSLNITFLNPEGITLEMLTAKIPGNVSVAHFS